MTQRCKNITEGKMENHQPNNHPRPHGENPCKNGDFRFPAGIVNCSIS